MNPTSKSSPQNCFYLTSIEAIFTMLSPFSRDLNVTLKKAEMGVGAWCLLCLKGCSGGVSIPGGVWRAWMCPLVPCSCWVLGGSQGSFPTSPILWLCGGCAVWLGCLHAELVRLGCILPDVNCSIWGLYPLPWTCLDQADQRKTFSQERSPHLLEP